MTTLRATSRIVERFLRRRESEPDIDIERFLEEEGGASGEVVEALNAALRLEALLGDLGGGDVAVPGEDDAGPDAPDPLLGTSVGGFRIETLLGRGGSGAVYAARDETLDRRVALKILHPALLSDPGARERFRREAAITARLSHPHIVPVFAAGEDEGLAWIAMTFVEGESLDAVIRRRGPAATDLPEAGAVARLGADLADALAHAHGLGLVHRDVKPGNVLMDAEGRAWLVDFGLARDLAGSRLTASGHYVGTPLYMAPEQLDPSIGPVDRRTDIFALGLTLLEYSGAAISTALAGGVRAGAQGMRRLPRDLGTALLKAMDPDPDRRYAEAALLSDDLRRILAGEPVLARRPGPWLRLRRAARRRPAVAAAAAMLLLGAAAVSLLLVVRGVERTREIAGLRDGIDILVERGDPGDAAARLDRLRAAGAADPALEARLAARRMLLSAERRVDQARAVVFDHRSSADEIAKADRDLVEAIGVLDGRAAFDPLMLRAMAAFRLRRIPEAERLAIAAAASRGIAIPPELLGRARLLALRMLATSPDRGVVRSVFPSKATGPEEDALVRSLLDLARRHAAESPEAMAVAGTLLYGLRRPARAIEFFNQALDRDPMNWPALWMKTQCYIDLGNVAAALETARGAVAAARDRAGPFYLRGVVQIAGGALEEALADLDQALLRDPAFWQAAKFRADVLEDLGRTDEAEAAFTKVLELNPGSGRSLFKRGQLRYRGGRPEEALADVEAAVGKPDMEQDDVLVLLAAVRCRLSRFDEALAAAEGALAMDRSLPWAWFWLSEAREGRGELHQAARDSALAARLAERVGAPDAEVGAFRSDAEAKAEAAGPAPRTESEADEATRLAREIAEDLPWLRFDRVDLLRRRRLALCLAARGDGAGALSCLRDMAAGVQESASRPPRGIDRDRFREALGRGIRRFLRDLENDGEIEPIREVEGFSEALRALEGVARTLP